MGYIMDNEKIIFEKLKIIRVNGGDVLRGLKANEKAYAGFGELYFSEVNFGEIKAWKKHKKMVMNLIVPSGVVKFVFFDDRENSMITTVFQEIVISKNNYRRITVPPNIWFGFKGIGKETNLVVNLSNIEHSDDEVERKEINKINYKW